MCKSAHAAYMGLPELFLMSQGGLIVKEGEDMRGSNTTGGKAPVFGAKPSNRI